MQCISPITIKRESKVFRGARTERAYEHVPCGRCQACHANNRNDWTFRIEEEVKTAKSALFITLTYAPEHLPENYNLDTGEVVQTLDKKHITKFLKNVRSHYDYQETKTGIRAPKIKFFAVGEYGTRTARPHYHIILLNVPREDHSTLVKKWNKGSIHLGTVSTRSIRYTTKYILKGGTHPEGSDRPFRLMSKKLGNGYLQRNHNWHKENQNFYVINGNGHKQRIPRYYKAKLFGYTELKNHREKSEEISIRETLKKDKILRKKGINPAIYRDKQIQQYLENQKSIINKNQTL